MYCENCGKKNEDGARFCEACGTPLVSYEQQTRGTVHLYDEAGYREGPSSYTEHTEYRPRNPYEETYYREPVQKPKQPKGKGGFYAAIVVTVVLVIALVIGVVMLVKSNNEINEEDDVQISESMESVTPAPTEEVTESVPSEEVVTVPETPEVTETPTAAPTATPIPTAIPTPVPTEVPTVEYVAVKYGLSAPVTDFQFPYSSERLLTQAELDSMESDSIDVMHSKSQLAINEILARYGYSFDPSRSDTSRDIYERVAGKDWYVKAQAQCSYSSANALIQDMNSIEKQNIELVNAWQQAHGCYY